MSGNNTAEFRRQETGDRRRECGEVGKLGSGEVGDLAEISLLR